MIEIIVDNKDINQIVIKTRDNGRYINIREEVKVIHNMAILTEIPDKFYGVKISNMYEVDKNYFNLNQLRENEYYVNYNLGYIFFNSYKDTNTFLVDYQGTGVIYYPASRIITKDRGNYIETLEDIVSKSQEALNSINNVNEIVNKANEMYIKLNTSIKNATDLSSFLSNLIKNGELTVSDIENSIKQASLKKDELENTISKTQKSIDDINNAKIQAINSVNSTKDILINDITKQADFKKKELNLIIEDADSEQSVLKSTINESERKNKELETTISNASQHKSDLENDISQASILEQNLDNNITVGSTLKTDLDLSVLNANDNKKKLDKTILNSEEMIKDSDKTIVKLKDMISDTNNKKEELNITIHDSIDKYNSLKETISNADNKNSEIKNTVSNANKINDILGGNIESGSTKINEIDDKILEVKDKLDNISKREEEIDKLEKDRDSNEDARILNEKNRVENEKVRNSNENKRENNFKQMQEIHNQFNSICKEFLSDESYKTGNKVIYNGSTYECIKDNIGIKPTNNEHWHCVVAKGKDGLGSGNMHTDDYDKNGNGIIDNAEKVNGFTVECNVPADAKFTDTDTKYDDKELRQSISNITENLGKENLKTKSKTIKGAINELFNDKQSRPFKEYGVRWSKSIDKVERLGNAIGLTAITSGRNDFDNLYPWSEMKRCNLDLNGQVVAYYGDIDYVEDGTYQCMVEIPKFWFKMVNVSDDVLECWICDKPKDGYILHPAFYRCRNKACDDQSGVVEEVDYRYRSSYLCSEVNGKAVSKIGVLPKASIIIGDSRKLCKANGNGWGLLDYNLFYATQLLYLIEYADFDSQSKLGRGYVDGNDSTIQTGGTSSLGNKSGNQGNNGTDGKHQVSYRGIEDIWGSYRYWIDGFYCDRNRTILIGNKGFNDSGNGYKSYSTGLSNNVSGYIGNVFGSNELGFVIKNGDGSATSKLYDYGCLCSSCLPFAGGDWVYGSSAGAFYFGCSFSASGASSYISLSLAF